MFFNRRTVPVIGRKYLLKDSNHQYRRKSKSLLLQHQSCAKADKSLRQFLFAQEYTHQCHGKGEYGIGLTPHGRVVYQCRIKGISGEYQSLLIVKPL